MELEQASDVVKGVDANNVSQHWPFDCWVGVLLVGIKGVGR